MSSIPEGAATVSVEGVDIKTATAAAAEQLEIPAKQVKYKLDLSHFRSSTGGSLARNTVKIIAWAGPEVEEAPAPEAKAESKKEDSSSEEAPKAEAAEEPAEELGETEASKFAAEWIQTLLKHMDVEAELVAGGDDSRVKIIVKAGEKGGRIVGRKYATLNAIRHILGLAMKKFGDLTVEVDVPREGGDRRSRDGERRGRGRDGERRGRGRDGDRRGRGRDRDGDRRGRGRDRDGDRRGRGRDRDGDRPKSKYPEEKLQAVARRAAAKAQETGRTITINLELNSYDRRVIHLAVSEEIGADSQSIVKEGVKYVQVVPVIGVDAE